jgi:hypothetical protein
MDRIEIRLILDYIDNANSSSLPFELPRERVEMALIAHNIKKGEIPKRKSRTI